MRDPDSEPAISVPESSGRATAHRDGGVAVAEHGGWGPCRWGEGPGPGADRCRRGVGRSSIWPAAACPLEVRAALISTQFPGPWPCLILCFLSSMFNYIVVNE